MIKGLALGEFATLESRLPRGGALRVRRLRNVPAMLYWRYSYQGGTPHEPIGPYDSSAPPKSLKPTAKGYSIQAALVRCAELAVLQAERANTGGLREAKLEEQQQFAAKKAARVAKQERTLGKLLEAYVDHLKTQERRSHYDANNIFRLHLEVPFPELWATPAADVTPGMILDTMRRLIAQKKGRTSNKLRSYLASAYQCAVDVESRASIPKEFKQFEIVLNPVSATKRDAGFDKADKRPLSAEELRKYWELLKGRAGLPAAALRLHLLTGGQRIEQLTRLLWRDVTDTHITIFDGKGRPGSPPRTHVVPLVPEAAAAIKAIGRTGGYVLSTTAGKKPVSATTLSAWAKEIVGDAVLDFQLKRVRSGVETLLAANGISRDLRGHIQSHGLTGVQARHYDGHDYDREKRRALELLASEIDDRKPSRKVVGTNRTRA